MESRAFTGLAVVAALAGLVATWSRLFLGMDLRDESYYILVPWRWALGDVPFVHEQNLLQIPGLLVYPFVKAFGIVRGYDPTGLVLYTRHLYLLMMVGVGVAVFMLLRRLVRWQLALLVSSVYVTYIFWSTPQLSYNTMALAFLTVGATLGAWVVVAGRGRGYALASGAAFGVAVIAYPTLLFVIPFYAVFLAFALGRRAVAMVAELALAHPPSPEGPATGPVAWRALSAWVLGGNLVLVPLGLVILSFGLSNLIRSWERTMSGARGLEQLGGASKSGAVVQAVWELITWRPYLIAAALLVYLVYRHWPRVGRVMLATVPLALWMVIQRPLQWGSGYVLVLAFVAPYLYLFVPHARRETGARLLLWIWAPAMIAGAMVAYTSAAGFLSSPVGLAPALLASGLFLAWALEAAVKPASSGREAPLPWLSLVVLIAVAAVAVGLQFQIQQRAVPYRELTSRFDSGPWWGIKVTPERRRLLDGFAADLKAQGRPGDQLLIFYEACGYYLYWKGGIAADRYWLGEPGSDGPLPQLTIDYFRQHRVVPTLVFHLMPTTMYSEAQLQAASGDLEYPLVLVRPKYVVLRKPADESTAEVLARLPRE